MAEDKNLRRLALSLLEEYEACEKSLIHIRDEVASIPQPIKKLVAVEKISLKAKSTTVAKVSIPSEALMFTGIDMQKRLESGWFTVFCGNLSTRIHIS